MSGNAVMVCHHDLRLVVLSILISIMVFAARELVTRPLVSDDGLRFDVNGEPSACGMVRGNQRGCDGTGAFLFSLSWSETPYAWANCSHEN